MFACVTQVYGYDTIEIKLGDQCDQRVGICLDFKLIANSSESLITNYSLLKLLTGFANAALMD